MKKLLLITSSLLFTTISQGGMCEFFKCTIKSQKQIDELTNKLKECSEKREQEKKQSYAELNQQKENYKISLHDITNNTSDQLNKMRTDLIKEEQKNKALAQQLKEKNKELDQKAAKVAQLEKDNKEQSQQTFWQAHNGWTYITGSIALCFFYALF